MRSKHNAQSLRSKFTKMKKQTYLILFCVVFLAACGGGKSVKPSAISKTSKPASSSSSPPTASDSTNKSGGYYLDDGPGANTRRKISIVFLMPCLRKKHYYTALINHIKR